MARPVPLHAWVLFVAPLACRPHPASPAMPAPMAAAPLPAARPELPATGTVNIRLTHEGGDAWLADYALPEPTLALAWGHPRTARAGWRIVDPTSATLQGSFIVSKEPFARLRIRMTTSTVQPDKEYSAFNRYTDSGQLVYTGQLSVAPAVCASGDCPDGHGLSAGEAYPGTLTLAPRGTGERVVVYGHSPASESSIALTADGTYAYFGNLVPVETPSFVGVIDRGLPDWIQKRVTADLPELFALYAEKFGPLEAPKPTVFLTFAKRDRGESLGGGVLKPHVLALNLELGKERLIESSEARFEVDRLVAHEAAHFWNADHHPMRGDARSAWLDEGSADALAMRVLHATRVLDDAAYRSALSEAASECGLWLSGGEALAASTRHGHARAFYVCGSTLSLVAEAAVRRRDPGADLFTFWRQVFDEGKPAYDEATFLHVLDRLGGDPAVTEIVRHLVHDALADPTETLRDALRLVGIETNVILDGPWPREYEQHGSIPEMSALLPRACAEALGFDGDVEVRPVVRADRACPGLLAGEVIDSVAGEPVGPHGATSFQRAFAACRAEHAIEVVTSKQRHVSVSCEPKTRAAPRYFELTRIP